MMHNSDTYFRYSMFCNLIAKYILDDPNESRNYWCDLIHDIFLTKTFQDDEVKKIRKKRPKYMFSFVFLHLTRS